MTLVRLVLGTAALAVLALSANLGGWPLAVGAILVLVAVTIPRRVWASQPRTARVERATNDTTNGDDQQ